MRCAKEIRKSMKSVVRARQIEGLGQIRNEVPFEGAELWGTAGLFLPMTDRVPQTQLRLQNCWLDPVPALVAGINAGARDFSIQ